MANGDNPAAGTAESAPATTELSFAQGVDDITEMLDGTSEEATTEESKVENQQADNQPGDTEDDLVITEDDADADDAHADDEADADNADDEEATTEVQGGRFAPDTAKVRMPDGTIVSIADLKGGNLRQADYSRKTEELSIETKKLDEAKEFVGQHALDLAERRKRFLQIEQTFGLQPPDPSMMDVGSPNYDPIGYMQSKHEYDQRQALIGNLRNEETQEQQAAEAKAKEEHEARAAKESQALFSKAPDLKNPNVYNAFWADSLKTMEKYGYGADEIGSVVDHRSYLVMRDLNRYRKALEKSSSVKTQIRDKPQMVQGQKRQDPQAVRSRQQTLAKENLRKTGTLESGIDALKNIVGL